MTDRYGTVVSILNILFVYPHIYRLFGIRGVKTLSSNQSTDVIMSLESPIAVQASRIQHGNQWPETYEGVSSSTGTFTVYPRG